MAEAVHCLYCFDVLASHLHRTSCPDPSFPADASFPLFVTWNKQNRSGHLDLRGCIGVPGTLPEAARHDLTRRVRACPGCLSPLPITSLKTYALNSALKDRRFSPIDARELPHLHCTVSLLTSFEVACSLDDWTIGPHGVMIDYVDPTNQVPRTTELSRLGRLGPVLLRVPPVRRAPQHRRTRLPPQARSAVYLPDVIPEQGWTKAETVDSLVRKSGYTGQAAALGSRALVLQLGSHTPARGARASHPPDPAHTVRRPCTPPRSERGPWHRSGLGTAQLLPPLPRTDQREPPRRHQADALPEHDVHRQLRHVVLHARPRGVVSCLRPCRAAAWKGIGDVRAPHVIWAIYIQTHVNVRGISPRASAHN